MQTLEQSISHCADTLSQAPLYYGHGTDNAWDEAVQLVLFAAGMPVDADRSVLNTPLTPKQSSLVSTLLAQRVNEQIPLPYLTGRTVFAGLELLVDRRALVPRSPIAELIEQGFAPWFVAATSAPHILDLCCGGGCIGLACAAHMPDSRVDLADIDAQALALASSNVVKQGLQQRTELIRSDLFDGLKGRRYHLLVSNPPYVDAQDIATMPAEYHHEPPHALGSGADGLDITHQLLAQAGEFLEPDGLLVVEVGNSWEALEQAYPLVPFTWVEFARGGHGVFVMSASELAEYASDLGHTS